MSETDACASDTLPVIVWLQLERRREHVESDPKLLRRGEPGKSELGARRSARARTSRGSTVRRPFACSAPAPRPRGRGGNPTDRVRQPAEHWPGSGLRTAVTAIEVNAAKMKRDIYLRLSECTEEVKRIPIAARRFSIHLQDWNEPLFEAESASGPAPAGFVAGGPSIRRDLLTARGLTPRTQSLRAITAARRTDSHINDPLTTSRQLIVPTCAARSAPHTWTTRSAWRMGTPRPRPRRTRVRRPERHRRASCRSRSIRDSARQTSAPPRQRSDPRLSCSSRARSSRVLKRCGIRSSPQATSRFAPRR